MKHIGILPYFDQVVKYQKANDYAVVPTKADTLSAGDDLYAAILEPITIAPGETVKITTGLKIELPVGTFGAIFPRSGLATKQGLALANTVGIIDASYRGEVIVALHNYSNTTRTIQPKDRIAQLIILPYFFGKYEEADSLSETERGEGGFGHSGT